MNHLRYFLESPKRKMPWFIAGSPVELAKLFGERGRPNSLLRTSNFVGEALYRSITERGGFDYIKLSVPAGGEVNYPTKYGGVSGGGIWFIPFVIDANTLDPNSIKSERPFLAGVAFHESGMRKTCRVITGHGPNSIYQQVVATFKE